MNEKNVIKTTIETISKIDSSIKLFAYSLGIVLLITLYSFNNPNTWLISVPLGAIILIMFMYSFFNNKQPDPVKLEKNIPRKGLNEVGDLKDNMINDITKTEFSKLYDQIKTQVNSNGIIQQQIYGIYISCPMASFSDDNVKIKLKAELAQLMILIKHKYNDILIECPAAIQSNTELDDEDDVYDDPQKAFMLCYTRILFSKTFILLYPQKLLSSTILEIGLAIAFGKRIIVFQNEKEELPFLLQKIHKINNSNIEIVKYNGQIKDVKKIVNNRNFNF